MLQIQSNLEDIIPAHTGIRDLLGVRRMVWKSANFIDDYKKYELQIVMKNHVYEWVETKLGK